MNKILGCFSVFVLAMVVWTNYVWDSAFDQGTAVSLCVVESFKQFEGQKVAINEEVCQEADDYMRHNPLWKFSRNSKTKL